MCGNVTVKLYFMFGLVPLAFCSVVTNSTFLRCAALCYAIIIIIFNCYSSFSLLY